MNRNDKISLALHKAVVRRLRSNPELWSVPPAILDWWYKQDGHWSLLRREWHVILETWDREDILRLLVSRSQKAQQLRKAAPFTGIISPEERAKIFARYPLPRPRHDLDRAIERVKEVMKMDFRSMTPADRLKLCCEVSEIGLKFKAVEHDCELGTLLDALEVLRANLGS